MKTLKYISYLLLISSMLLIGSCGGDGSDEPSPIERFAGTWSASAVTLDGVDVTSPEYSDFTITFNDDGSYITTDGDPVFSDQGGFFTISSSSGATAELIVSDVAMSAEFNADDTSVTISFTANDAVIGARLAGLVGNYVFVLNKQ